MDWQQISSQTWTAKVVHGLEGTTELGSVAILQRAHGEGDWLLVVSATRDGAMFGRTADRQFPGTDEGFDMAKKVAKVLVRRQAARMLRRR